LNGTKAELIERLKNPNDKSNKTKDQIRLDYSKLKIDELKDLCRSVGVKIAGNKSQLVERLMNPNKKSNRPNPIPFGGKQNRSHSCLIF
jgi:hypothetical protein